MSLKESLDWTKLAGDVTPDTGRIPYGPNKHLFRKVAFDVFQLNSSPVESLWTLEDGDDGNQYLVAMYGEEEDSEGLEAKSHWEALSDRDGKNVTLIYKNSPIQRFASSDYGFSKEDVHVFQQTLVEKLSSDQSSVAKLLKSQPKEKLDILVAQFPELQSMAAEPMGLDLHEMESERPAEELEREDDAGAQQGGFEEEGLTSQFGEHVIDIIEDRNIDPKVVSDIINAYELDKRKIT